MIISLIQNQILLLPILQKSKEFHCFFYIDYNLFEVLLLNPLSTLIRRMLISKVLSMRFLLSRTKLRARIPENVLGL